MILNWGWRSNVGEDSSKGNQSWILIERTDVEAEAPILWPPDVKSWLMWKDPDDGKDWGQEEKGMTEDEMVGWHHWLNGHEFGWTLGVGDGQGGLVCCSPWSRKESDRTEQLNWTELNWKKCFWLEEIKDTWQLRKMWDPGLDHKTEKKYTNGKNHWNVINFVCW